MPRSRPAWWDPALTALVQGNSVAAAARAAGVRRETVSRAMADPESAFSKELAAARAAAAPVQSDRDLLAKALARLDQSVDSDDRKIALDAAKAIVARLGPQAAAEQEAAPAEEEITPAQAVQELAAALPAVEALRREHPEAFSAEVVEELKAGCRRLLDDLDALPQPPPAPPSPPAAPPRPLLN